jgi:hypothetical protein
MTDTTREPRVVRPSIQHPDEYQLNVTESDVLFLADAIGTKCDELLRDINKCEFTLDGDTTKWGSEDAAWLANAYARLASLHNQITFLVSNPYHTSY